MLGRDMTKKKRTGETIAAAARAVQTAGPPREQAIADLRAAFARAGTPKAGPGLLLALDVDGTILHHDTALSGRVARAIDAHRKAGTRIVLASGRGIFGTQVAALALGLLSGPAVCSNGAITVRLGEGPERLPDGTGMPFEIADLRTFDPRPAILALHEALPEAIIAVERVGEPRLVTKMFPPGELSGPCAVVPFGQILIEEATRITVRCVDMEVTQMRAAVEAAGLRGIAYNIGWSAWLDVSPPGVSKADALERVRREMDIPLPACVAAGDGSNDVEMVAWAGVGVAMGGGPAELKAVADAVTTTVGEDGLAEVLELLL